MPETPLVTGHVEADDLDTALKHLSVEVRSASEPSRVETVISLPLSGYFEIRDLSKSRHLIQLRSGLPANSFIFDSDPFEINLENQPQVHVGPLRYKIQERHHKQVGVDDLDFGHCSGLPDTGVDHMVCPCIR